MDSKQHNYLWRMEQLQKQIQAMWLDKHVQLYNDAELPGDLDEIPSVFLAGPTSRNQVLECNWRCEAVRLLREAGYMGWIFCPEPRGKELPGDFTERSYIHSWESSRLLSATHVAFWIPRKADELLGLNTNLELGVFLGLAIGGNLDGQGLFVGWPTSAERMGLPKHYLTMAGMNQHTTLQELCESISASPRQRPKVC
jgi:hypothetical protein